MKFTTAIAVLATAATVSALSIADTNANRLARGLPPKAPAKRATPVTRTFNFSPCLSELLNPSFCFGGTGAKRGKPSGHPHSGQCSTGEQHCCESTENAGSSHKSAGLLGALGLDIAPDVLVGLKCSPLSVGGNSWYIHFQY
jgi:hypothetical protein